MENQNSAEILLQDLSDDELEAKKITKTILQQYNKPIDTGKPSDLHFEIPAWFDETKYKRGQQYFKDNRFGILGSNLCGLILLLAEPNGLEILRMTEKSSEIETARRRYVETILHTLSWYDYELTRDSKAWRSLQRVRKLHLNASNMAMHQNGSMISKTEVIFTLFGFMGIALIRPHLLGIKHDNREDREGFIHLWAVLSYMIGIEDELNVCLHRLEIVEIVMEIMMRYIFVPLVQFEPPHFKSMVEAMMNGMNKFIPDINYENNLFMARRICGIPGYQYDVDLERPTIIKDIFTEAEISEIAGSVVTRLKYIGVLLYSPKLKLYKIIKANHVTAALVDANENDLSVYPGFKEISLPEELGVAKGDRVFEKTIDYRDWSNELNDSKFAELAFKDRVMMRLRCVTFRYGSYRIGHYLNDKIIGIVLNKIRRWYEENFTVGIYN